jgi:hypothetical protein
MNHISIFQCCSKMQYLNFETFLKLSEISGSHGSEDVDCGHLSRDAVLSYT